MPNTPVPLPSRAQLLARARTLLAEPDLGNMGYSEYDAAWVARVPKPGTREPAFPEVLEVVRTSQAADGGWAPQVDYVSARILATLASVLAVTEFDNGLEARRQAERGTAYVREAWPRLREEPDLTIGFELVGLSLLKGVSDRGLGLDELRAQAEPLFNDKMSRVPPQLIYSPMFSLGFSLEFLDDKLDVERARALLVGSGTITSSVSATAYFVMRSGDVATYEALRERVARWGATNIPYGAETRLWTSIWTLHNLHVAGLTSELKQEVRPLLDFIHGHIGPHGLAWSTEIAYGDSDDSAVAFAALHDFGYRVDWSLLSQYERHDGFIGFLAERGASVSANAHVLESIHGRPYPGGKPSEDKAAQMLLRQRRPEGYWTDKWQASPYYPTSCAVKALLNWEPSTVLPTLEWLLKTQRPDGGWGWFGASSPEETAYALHALVLARFKGLTIDSDVLARGAAYLAPYDGSESPEVHPKLWISKILYRPLHVVRSAVLAAQSMCEQALASKEQPSRRTTHGRTGSALRGVG